MEILTNEAQLLKDLCKDYSKYEKKYAQILPKCENTNILLNFD